MLAGVTVVSCAPAGPANHPEQPSAPASELGVIALASELGVIGHGASAMAVRCAARNVSNRAVYVFDSIELP